jgi:hypothetical protein
MLFYKPIKFHLLVLSIMTLLLLSFIKSIKQDSISQFNLTVDLRM